MAGVVVVGAAIAVAGMEDRSLVRDRWAHAPVGPFVPIALAARVEPATAAPHDDCQCDVAVAVAVAAAAVAGVVVGVVAAVADYAADCAECVDWVDWVDSAAPAPNHSGNLCSIFVETIAVALRQ